MKKQKYILEYPLNNVSPQILWVYLSTSSGLGEWFADKVSVNDKEYTFIWNKAPLLAHLQGIRQESYIRFKWLDEDHTDGDVKRYFFEFAIQQSELTGETILLITDYAYPDEIDESKELWDYQVGNLKRQLGV